MNTGYRNIPYIHDDSLEDLQYINMHNISEKAKENTTLSK